MNAAQPDGWTPQRVHRWATTRLGVGELRRVAGGNSRQSWIAPDSGLFIRVQTGVGLSAYYTLAREARIYRLLNRAGATAPTLRAESADGAVLAMDVAVGSADVAHLRPSERLAVLRDFVARLEQVHRVPLPADDTFGRPVPADRRTAITDELDRWTEIMRSAGQPAPAVLEFGLRWLRDNVPAASGPPVLVHGDAGTGNFLHDGRTVTALIDWEFAHPGDPAEDVAWSLMRGALDRLPEIPAALREWPGYADARRDGRLGYHLASVLWKVMVIRHRGAGVFAPNVGRNLYYRLVHQRLFIEVMAHNLGLPEPDVDAPPDTDTARSWLFDYGIAQLKDVALPALPDGDPHRSLAGLVRVLRYLKAVDRGRGWLDAAQDPGLATALREGRIGCSAAWPSVATEVLREFALGRDALGTGPLPTLLGTTRGAA